MATTRTLAIVNSHGVPPPIPIRSPNTCGMLKSVSSVLWSDKLGSEEPNSAMLPATSGIAASTAPVRTRSQRRPARVPTSRKGSNRIAVNLTATASISTAPALRSRLHRTRAIAPMIGSSMKKSL